MYDYSYSYEMADTGALAVFAGFSMFMAIISIAIGIFMIIAMWKVFEKAGKPGYASIIPIYNIVVLFQISGLNPALLFLMLIPFLGQLAVGILMIIGYFNLAKYFHKDAGFGVGLWLLTPIFMAILAFGDATYEKID